MPQCSVPQCTNQGGHQFPSDSRLRRQWIIAIKRDELIGRDRMWIPGPAARVCSKHFVNDDYVTINYYGRTTVTCSTHHTLLQSVYGNVMLRHYDTDGGRRKWVKVKCGLQNGGYAESHKVRVRTGVGFTFYAIPTLPNATVYITTLP